MHNAFTVWKTAPDMILFIALDVAGRKKNPPNMFKSASWWEECWLMWGRVRPRRRDGRTINDVCK